jgi:hypothetical protein
MAVLLCAMLVAVPAPEGKDDTQKEVAKLQGTWVLDSIWYGPNNWNVSRVSPRSRSRMVISGNKWVEEKVNGDKGAEMFFRIPAAGKIDNAMNPYFKEVWYNRYEVDGDTLKMFHPILGAATKPEDRPKELKPTDSRKDGCNTCIWIWKRVKP